MKNYMFKCNTTMKAYNYKKWWIDNHYIRNTVISAENLKEAMQKFRDYCEENGVEISKNAMRNKQPMYIDTADGNSKQIGYVITGKTAFNDDYRRWVKDYVEIWATIQEVFDIDFESEV